MKIRRTLQTLAALVAGTAIVAVAALPSGALTGNVSSGILTIDLSPQLASSLDPGSAPCRGTGSGSLDLVTTELTISDPFTYGGTTYFLLFSGTAPVTLSAGTMTMGPIYAPDVGIYTETSPGSCVADLGAGPLCFGLTTSPFDPITLSGSWTGTTATLSGDADLAGSFCPSPFSGLNGMSRTLTITNMVVDF